jgi:hypothetical protein
VGNQIWAGALDAHELQQIQDTMLAAYRWQYILSGAQHPQFVKLLTGMITPAQVDRLMAALSGLHEGGTS